MSRLLAIRCVVVWSVLLVSGPVYAGDADEEIRRLADSFLADKPYAGLSIGIVRGDQTSWMAFGQVQTGGRKQLPDEHTLYEIGSITKAFTGTLLACEVKRKSVALDDPLQQYLPADWQVPQYEGQSMTLLDLATHRSSLPVQPPLIGLFAMMSGDPANPYKRFGDKQLAGTLRSMKLQRPIGERFEYSNLGVGLLGHALVNAAQAESYEALLIDRILEPLEMNDTRILLPARLAVRKATGHRADGKPTQPWDFGCLEGCGALRSCVADMAKFVRLCLGHANDELVEIVQFAQKPRRPIREQGPQIGLCWLHGNIGESEMIWHNGGTGGYRSFFGVLPEQAAGIVVLSSSAHGVDRLATDILSRLATD